MPFTLTGTYQTDLLLVLGLLVCALSTVLVWVTQSWLAKQEVKEAAYLEWRTDFTKRIFDRLDTIEREQRSRLENMAEEWRREAKELREMSHALDLRVRELETWRRYTEMHNNKGSG